MNTSEQLLLSEFNPAIRVPIMNSTTTYRRNMSFHGMTYFFKVQHWQDLFIHVHRKLTFAILSIITIHYNLLASCWIGFAAIDTYYSDFCFPSTFPFSVCVALRSAFLSFLVLSGFFLHWVYSSPRSNAFTTCSCQHIHIQFWISHLTEMYWEKQHWKSI